MNTYEVRIGNETLFIFGYSWRSACRKAGLDPKDITCICIEHEDDSAWW